jgi:hypothetical protein
MEARTVVKTIEDSVKPSQPAESTTSQTIMLRFLAICGAMLTS